ncbi:TEF transcription factor, PAR bZIP family member a [Kryptolebias marmoratus]|uniref:TEF transcription factor, PAR bZIP family member a n=1 Tax=Kryptolebias marmoratus TaxID=37003 RepID=A0A3Q2ZYK2_KRYMA|nr:TEF transcription factor, PAR bZIP family member a [Kryptolebias marmoratus]
MSGEAVHIKLHAGGLPPTSFPVVLKKILEMPPPNILDGDDDTEKEKLGLSGIADLGGGSEMGPSAALTPAIWDKTIPYDGETFHLEYMDLEEFLLENDISSLSDAAVLKDEPTSGMENENLISSAEMKVSGSAGLSAVTLMPIQDLEKSEEELLIITKSDADVTCDVSTEVTTSKDRVTPEPVNPDDIEVAVNYEPDPTDLVLSSVPGGDLFDPRKHKFSEDELKPQPMIKKAKKVFVPEDQKDEKYWQRRKKNNVAAKRSRDARRLKENQITVRAAFLERENLALRSEVAELRKECGRYQKVVGRYEAKFGPL